MQNFDTSSLLSSIKRRGFVPTAQATFTNADQLALATEELQNSLAELLMTAREDYFLATSDVPLVAGQAGYAIPARAMGMALRNVAIVATDGSLRPLTRFTLEQLNALNLASTGSPRAVYVKANTVYTWPVAATVGEKLRMDFLQRPSALVQPSAVGVISSIGGASVTLTGTAPATFTNGVALDFVKATPGFECVATDVTLTSVSTGTTLNLTVPTGLAVGQYVCLAGESPVPQIPVELHPVLAQMVVCKLLEAIGDTEGLQAAAGKLSAMQASALVLVSGRIDGELPAAAAPEWL